MQSLIKISDAAIIAIHTLNYIIKNENSIYIASEIAKDLEVSYNHLSKILQLLVKHGYLKTKRGPRGGYYITKKGDNAKIRDMIELIDGKIETNNCFMTRKICSKNDCILKDFLMRVVKDFEYTINKKIKDF